MTLQVVWFKRDLRVADHEALYRACQAGPTLCVYTIETQYWQQPDASNRQWLFVREALADLDHQLQQLGGKLVVFQHNIEQVLVDLKNLYGAFTLHSHQEIGNLWTYQRDKAVALWCQQQQCAWHEYSQFGVVRPLTKRQAAFADFWQAWVAQPQFVLSTAAEFVVPAALGLTAAEWPQQITQEQYPCLGRQLGGRQPGLAVLHSFLTQRGEWYRGSMSSPLTAESACSRLSPYLAYGCLSLREIAQSAATTRWHSSHRRWQKSLADFYRRLQWHCYFMQKFDSQSSMEHQAQIPAMAQLNRPYDPQKFAAWQHGNTGWPLVDACMRYLHHHGWINFRMRAMLVSVATYSLSLPWQPVASWLAQQFVDFEPGIHYPQIQMQSGLSDQQVLRIYNPITQAFNLDEAGDFVRRWVPELAQVSTNWIFEPWKMPANIQAQVGWTRDYFYPAPLVDFEFAHRLAKQEITHLRAQHSLPPANKHHHSTPSTRPSAPQSNHHPQSAHQQLDLFS